MQMHYFSLSSINGIVFMNVFFFKEYSPSFRDLESPGAPGSGGIGILERGRDRLVSEPRFWILSAFAQVCIHVLYSNKLN